MKIYSASEQGVDLSKLVSVRLEFEVDYGQKPGFNPRIFGKDPSLYPQNLGKLCKKEVVRLPSEQ